MYVYTYIHTPPYYTTCVHVHSYPPPHTHTHTHTDLSDFSDFGRNIVTLDLGDTLAPLFIQREEECKEQLPQAEEEMEGMSYNQREEVLFRNV